MGEYSKTVGLSPEQEIEYAILRIEEAFHALDFGGSQAAEAAQGQVRHALDAIRHELDKAGSAHSPSTEEIEDRG